jgi:YrbI family 3-deoxy-D-manno-octulosonate 8-phosphate phosphatase
LTLKEKISKIKIVLTDIDGVLTDGGLYYNDDGIVMKKFFVKDGMGAVLLKEKGIEVGIVTSDNSDIALARGKRLKLDLVYNSARDKKEIMNEVCFVRNLEPENIAFIGDDVNDLGILQMAGLSACPNDAIEEVKDIVDYVCKKDGGQGAFRELANMIIKGG